MALKVTYKNEDIIDEASDCVKVMKTAGKVMEDDVTVEYTGGTPPTLITKNIIANGTYNASSDNADGYSSVTVNVPDKLSQLLQGTITYIKVKNGEFLPSGYEQGQQLYKNLIFVSANNNGHYFSSSTLRNAQRLKYANIGAPTLLGTFSFTATPNIKAIIITSSSVCSLQNTNAFGAQSAITAGTGFVYVSDSLKTDYQTATNWTTYANQIKGFSEAASYDATTTYEIGDVCKHNNKFYGYCKKDLTSSTGNAPTGTTADNDYWEYVADIEVV